jgi:PAS domain S-box-containing protein
MSTLEKRNHDYSKMVQKASEFSYKIMSKDGNLVFETLSEEFPEITGLSIKDVEDKADAEKFIHEDDLNKFWAHLDEIQNGKESTCAYRLRDNVGNYVEVLDYGRPVWDEDQQNVIGLRCAVSVDDAYEKAKA